MPYCVQVNVTPRVGYAIIIELFEDYLDPPKGFSSDVILVHKYSEAGKSIRIEEGIIDPSKWSFFIGIDDSGLRDLLTWISKSMLKRSNQQTNTLLNEFELELAINKINIDFISVDVGD
jgi:hypothetical protein